MGNEWQDGPTPKLGWKWYAVVTVCIIVLTTVIVLNT